MNYDDIVLGVENRNHPANEKESKKTVFEYNSLEACLDFCKATGEFEPLENAIIYNNNKKNQAVIDIIEVIKLLRSYGYDSTANFLCSVRDNLK
jgi:hypothetical protein